MWSAQPESCQHSPDTTAVTEECRKHEANFGNKRVPNPFKLRKEHIIHAPHQRQKLGYMSNISFDS